MVQSLISPFLWLAILGFAASLTVHVFSLFGCPSPFGTWTWALHIGIFLVWFPAVVVAHGLSKGAKRADFWRAVLRGCPQRVRVGAYVIFAYAVLNFVLFIGTPEPHTDIQNFRGFSGHWMAFYYVATAILYSARRLGPLGPRTCLCGHEVSPFSNFCDECGAQLPPLPI
jgi:hypothetical protein